MRWHDLKRKGCVSTGSSYLFRECTVTDDDARGGADELVEASDGRWSNVGKPPSTGPFASLEGLPSPTLTRRDTGPEMEFCVRSQEHLLKSTEDNPMPTAVPPPIAANAGTLGVRHVLCVIGLPERGKPYIARRLQAYLSFFHGAEVRIFNLRDYEVGPAPGCDENADALLADMRSFMHKEHSAAASNMSVERTASKDYGGEAASSHAKLSADDTGEVLPARITISSSASVGSTSSAAVSAARTAARSKRPASPLSRSASARARRAS